MGTEAKNRDPIGTKRPPRRKAPPKARADCVVDCRLSRDSRNALRTPMAPPGIWKVSIRRAVMLAAITIRATITPRPGKGASSLRRKSGNQLKPVTCGSRTDVVAIAICEAGGKNPHGWLSPLVRRDERHRAV